MTFFSGRSRLIQHSSMPMLFLHSCDAAVSTVIRILTLETTSFHAESACISLLSTRAKFLIHTPFFLSSSAGWSDAPFSSECVCSYTLAFITLRSGSALAVAQLLISLLSSSWSSTLIETWEQQKPQHFCVNRTLHSVHRGSYRCQRTSSFLSQRQGDCGAVAGLTRQRDPVAFGRLLPVSLRLQPLEWDFFLPPPESNRTPPVCSCSSPVWGWLDPFREL